MPNDLKSLELGFGRLTADLAGSGMIAMLRAIGEGAKDDVAQAVRRDIGDSSMSGWSRSRPIPILGRYDVQGSTLVVLPAPAGPMRVLEDGRNHSGAGFHGPGVNRRTGATARTKAGRLRKVRAVRGTRWNGVTRGRGTWSDASAVIARESVDRAEKVFRDIAAKSLL